MAMPFCSHINQSMDISHLMKRWDFRQYCPPQLWSSLKGLKLKAICGSPPSNQDNKCFSEERSGKHITKPNADLQKLDFLNIGQPQHHSHLQHTPVQSISWQTVWREGRGKRHFHDPEGISASHTNMKSMKVYSRGTSPFNCTHIFLKRYCIRHPFLFGLTTAPALHIDVQLTCLIQNWGGFPPMEY